MLVKRTKQFANISLEESAKYLLNVFEKYEFFKLPEKKQKVIIDNLLSYFDNIVCGIETYKKRNHLISENEILNHIDNKTFDLIINIKKVVIY